MRYIITLAIVAVLSGLILGLVKFSPRQAGQPQPKPDPMLDLSEQLAAGATNKYSPLGATTDEILSHQNDAMKNRVLGALLWRLGQKCERRGWDNLNATERRLIAVDAMNEEVLDGGFKQYLASSLGSDVDVALAGLKEMGAARTAALVERAMAPFPETKPPTDYDLRKAVMDQIAATANPVWEKCDNDYYEFKEDLEALELAYAIKQRADIVLP